MTDKEKLEAIRAEIHRLVDVRCYDKEMANDLFTTFMDSLPNEPVSEDLEKVAYKYANGENITCPCKECLIKTFNSGAQWQALHSLDSIKGMEEQAFLAGVEAEQINKSFSKDELLNKWRKIYETE